jgi:putative protein-disulfide isomerase
MAQEPKPTIVYIFDPICGWCYTFNPVIEKLHAKFKHRVDFVIVSGGMITDTKGRPISDMSEFILAGYEDMQNLTGVKFGEPYIKMVEEGKELLDSERPALAMTAFQSLFPHKSLEFARKLQESHFMYGKSYNNDSTYSQLVQHFGIVPDEFFQLMNSDSTKIATKNDFKKTEDAGINGFPTLLIKINGQVLPVTHGFEKYEKLEKKIEKLLNQ